MKTREQILGSLDRLPSMPAAAVKIIQRIQQPDVEVSELARLIELDGGLTACVLRLANSPLFGCARAIGSIREAVVRLGMERIFNMVVALAASPLTRRPIQGYGLSAGVLWQHMAAVALVTRGLAAELKIPLPDSAFTAALLHDIGKVAMGAFLELDAAPVQELIRNQHLPFDEAERQMFGIDHAEVGAAILERWSLPPAIVAVARWHHAPEQDPAADDEVRSATLAAVHVSDALCLSAGFGNGVDELRYHASQAAERRLGVTIHTKEAVLSMLPAALRELDALFGQNGGGAA